MRSMKSHDKSLPVRSRKAVTKGRANAHVRVQQKPAVLSDLQMFAQAHAFLHDEFLALKLQQPGRRRAAKAAELKVRSHQLILDVTRWMERNAE